MKTLLTTVIILITSAVSPVFGQVNDRGVFCLLNDFSKSLSPNENRIIVSVYWFKPNFMAEESFVVYWDSKLEKKKNYGSNYYFANNNIIRWGNSILKILNRETLKLTYTGSDSKRYDRHCDVLESEKQIDEILDKYSIEAEALLKAIPSKNKI